MDSQTIERYLQELGDELERRGFTVPVRLMIVGGAYMLLLVGNRLATEDVDIVLLDMPDTTHKTHETQAFIAAAKTVAKKNKLKQKWINDVVADFIRDMAPNPPLNFWKRYGKIEVYIPSQEYILTPKLMTFRKKDVDDVQALLKSLNITTREQAFSIVDHFVTDKGYYDVYDLEDNLDALF